MINKKRIVWVSVLCLVLILVGSVTAANNWSSSLNTKLISYWTMNDTSGDFLDSVTGLYNATNNGAGTDASGKLAGAVGFGDELNVQNDAGGFIEHRGTNDFAISLWYKPNVTTRNAIVASTSDQYWGIDYSSDSSDQTVGIWAGNGGWLINADFGTGEGTGSMTLGLNIWTHIIYQRRGNQWESWINGTLDVNHTESISIGGAAETINFGRWGGDGFPTGGASTDEVALYNRSLTNAEIKQLYNNNEGSFYDPAASPVSTLAVTLLSPTNDSKEITEVINFTADLNPIGVNVTNATFYLYNFDGSLNTTIFNETSGTSNYTVNWSVNDFTRGTSYFWNVYACSINGSTPLCDWGDNNFTVTSSAFSETAWRKNDSVLETSSQNFNLEIASISSVNAVSANLYYDNVQYATLVSDLSGGVYNVTRTIDVPLNNVSGNKTFFFELIATLTSGEILYQNSSIQQQEVNRTYLSYCNDTHNIMYINISTYNAENPFPRLNAQFKSAWSWFVKGAGGTVFRTYSFEDITETNKTFAFCMNNTATDYTVSSTLEIDNDLYAKNFHFLTNASFTNSSQNLSLYLLNDTKATATVLLTRDGQQAPIENVYISIQFYDVGTDTFYTVGMAKTSSEGEDLVYLNWYDSLYKFVMVKDGVIVKSTTPYKITETPQIFDIVTDVTFEFAKFDDFLYDLYFNETTSNFVLTFVKPSGSVDTGCLRVIKRNQTNDYLICETCESSTSATVYCNIGSSGNGTFIATFYATGSLKVVDTISKLIGVSSLIYEELGNTEGTILAIIFAGIILTFFLITPVLGVVGMMLGVLGGYALGFQPLDFLTFMGLLFVGGIVIWLLKR